MLCFWLPCGFLSCDRIQLFHIRLLVACCSSFLSCCAKLVFLPAVIAWQLFEEVRDKLQAKYHELQISNQVGFYSLSLVLQERVLELNHCALWSKHMHSVLAPVLSTYLSLS